LPSSTSKRSQGVTKVPAKGTALLLIDVINDLDFPGAEVLAEQAEPMAGRLAKFKRVAEKAGVPVIYVNDNFGRWRSDFRQTVAHCTSRRSLGRAVASKLKPTRQNYFVLKPQNSGFFETTLHKLLESLKVRRLILTGIAGDNCVLFTAHDAHMRDYRLFIASDCVVSNTPEQNEEALDQMKRVLNAVVAPSTAMRFSKA
jgi:nicotinamidase-related amidase